MEVGLLCSSEHLRWVIESASECECLLSQPGVPPESILRYEETAQLASADFLDSLGVDCHSPTITLPESDFTD